MKLDVGSGTMPRAGYVGCDIRDVDNVEIVCPAWEVHLHVENLEAVSSRHALEHLSYPEVEKAFQSWHSALLPGGVVEIVVPNLEYHVRSIVQGMDREEAPSSYDLAGLYGWQDYPEDHHRSGWTDVLLEQALVQAGFVSVEVWTYEAHLRAYAHRPGAPALFPRTDSMADMRLGRGGGKNFSVTPPTSTIGK